MIIPQLLDLSTTVSKLLIYFNINHVNDAPARQPSTSPSAFHEPPTLPRSPAAAVAIRSARQTGNEHFDQDRSSQLPMIASAEVPRWR